MSSVIEITNFSQYEAFKKRKRGVIFYGAKWCKSCKGIKELYERIANRYQNKIKMAYVDIDVAGLDFTSVPIFVSLYNGKQLDSIIGADIPKLKILIKEAINAK